jgi:hypothetical protein
MIFLFGTISFMCNYIHVKNIVNMYSHPCDIDNLYHQFHVTLEVNSQYHFWSSIVSILSKFIYVIQCIHMAKHTLCNKFDP